MSRSAEARHSYERESSRSDRVKAYKKNRLTFSGGDKILLEQQQPRVVSGTAEPLRRLNTVSSPGSPKPSPVPDHLSSGKRKRHKKMKSASDDKPRRNNKGRRKSSRTNTPKSPKYPNTIGQSLGAVIKAAASAPPLPPNRKTSTNVQITYEKDSNGKEVVLGATLESVIDELTSPTRHEQNMLFVFLLTYRSFCAPDKLLRILDNRLKIQADNFYDQETYLKQIQVIHVRTYALLRKWLSKFWKQDFSDDPTKADQVILTLAAANHVPAVEETLRKLISEQNAGLQDERRVVHNKVAPEPVIPKKIDWDSVHITEIPPIEIARQMTIIEYDLYKQIQPFECLGQAWTKDDADTKAPNIVKYSDHFNRMSKWVVTLILKEEKPKRRTKVIERFIQAADQCHQLNNLNGVMEIFSGLGHGAVDRLKTAWGGVDKKTKACYEKLKVLTAAERSYKLMREYLAKLTPPCVPFLVVYLSDLIFIDQGNPDYINSSDNLINFDKRRKLARAIQDLSKFQTIPYHLRSVPEIKKYLRSPALTDEKSLYDLSYKYQARGS